MKAITFLLLLILSKSVLARNSQWYVESMATIERAKSMTITEQMETIALMLPAGEKKQDSEAQEVFKTVQIMLLATPGHAKYYQNEIERLRSEVMENAKKNEEELGQVRLSGKKVIGELDYTAYMVRAMQTLRYLPSPETVAVLGHFLNDPEGRNGKTVSGKDRVRPGDDFRPRAINCEQACLAIRELGIEHAPSKVPEGHWLAKASLSDGEVDSWKDWWNEVKDNKRSYRFIGSNIDYGPDGPASKEQIERSNLKQLRDTERELGVRKPLADPATIAFTKPSILATVLTACVFGIAAVWCFFKNRNQ